MLDLQPYEAAGAHYDELYDAAGDPRPHYAPLVATLARLGREEVLARVRAIDTTLLQRGVTFTVYADATGTERVFPFDVIPRIITATEWDGIECGVRQRVRAINAFLYDVYHDERILREGRIPTAMVYSSRNYNREMVGVNVHRNVYIHVSGIDLIRDERGEFLVLEDNCRTPSGISYVLENRDILKRQLPDLFPDYAVCPVDDYPARLLDVLRYMSPPGNLEPTVVVLTPGIFNSAYFEHALLARRMGVELVEASDLTVVDNAVYLKTTRGLQRVDVIYRRVDDDYLDPLYFLPESTLGVTGLMNAYRAGNVTLANAIGTGVGDDKAIYRFVPEMIRFYLDEEPILNNVETFDCTEPAQLQHVLANLDKLVVKTTNASGGYGMLMGPFASTEERASFRDKIVANPRDFIAQPVVQLSSSPTLVDGRMVARRVDLRPFALYGRDVVVPPAALTRVALREDSLVVNSSQGGGSKDTWILQA
ncbi:MAG: circularly permuted type 2 ATP-grasp protein [Candidatus Eremiobacteraeota bacterium]|nr:circularly permuted type 2 ATP-grasp protein [Candidatus Eremiobacteraeota bacterium]